MPKPLSPRRAREFRDRHLKRTLGDRKRRAERWKMMVRINAPEVIAARYDVARRKLIRKGFKFDG